MTAPRRGWVVESSVPCGVTLAHLKCVCCRGRIIHVRQDGMRWRTVSPEIAELTSAAALVKTTFASWCSEGSRNLEATWPGQALSRFIDGPPQPSYAGRRNTPSTGSTRRRRADEAVQEDARPGAGSIYTVWVFKGTSSTGYEFEEFTDAKAFASAAEKGRESTKVAITNNESPQYLTVWERKA